MESFSEFFMKKGFDKGKTEGIVEGIAQGKAEGIVEGIAQGKAEGIAQGKAEGIAEGKSEILSCMLENGMKISEISTITKISRARVRRLLTKKS